MGLPMLATPFISIVLGVPHAIAVITIPIIVANLWQSIQGWKFRQRVPFLFRFLIIGTGGVALGTWLLSAVPSHWLELALGLIVVSYLATRLIAPNFRLSENASMTVAPFAGFLTGLFHAGAGISSPVSGTFLHSIKLPREVYVFAISTMFLVFSSLQLPMLFVSDIMTPDRLVQGLFALISVFIGLPLGARIGRHFSQTTFERLTLAILITTSIPLLWKGTAGFFG